MYSESAVEVGTVSQLLKLKLGYDSGLNSDLTFKSFSHNVGSTGCPKIFDLFHFSKKRFLKAKDPFEILPISIQIIMILNIFLVAL